MSIGVSFLSFPFVVPPFYQPPPPVSSPSGVSFTTFSGTVSYRTVRQRGPHPSYRHVTYPNGAYVDETVTYRRVTLPPSMLRLRTRNIHPGKLPSGNIRHRNITQT